MLSSLVDYPCACGIGKILKGESYATSLTQSLGDVITLFFY